MRFLGVSLFILFVAGATIPVAAQAVETEMVNGKLAAANQLLVSFQDDDPVRAAELLAELTSTFHLKVARRLGTSRVILLHSRLYNTPIMLRLLTNNSRIRFVEPNYLLDVLPEDPPDDGGGGGGDGGGGGELGVVNDPSFGVQYALRNIGQVINGVAGVPGADVRALEAWSISTGSAEVVVAEIDSGVFYPHPELDASVWSASAPFTVSVFGNPNFTCPAGSRGLDTSSRDCDPIEYENSHGTRVAGIIGAGANNNIGIAGVAPLVRILPIRALPGGLALTSTLVESVSFAIQMKQRGYANVRIINASWFVNVNDQPRALLDIILNARDNDILFVAAAGNLNINNDTSLHRYYPASFADPNCILYDGSGNNLGSCYASNVISVAATDNRDELWSSSAFGANSVSIAAPGVNVVSTEICTTCYTLQTGTSFAAPHVAGAAVLLLARCSLTANQIKSYLMDYADNTPALYGKVTSGRLNIDSAIRACGPPLLRLENRGGGDVHVSPSNISYPIGIWSLTFPAQTSVTLTAVPDSEFLFTGWSGACTGPGTCTLLFESDTSVTANFACRPELLLCRPPRPPRP